MTRAFRYIQPLILKQLKAHTSVLQDYFSARRSTSTVKNVIPKEKHDTYKRNCLDSIVHQGIGRILMSFLRVPDQARLGAVNRTWNTLWIQTPVNLILFRILKWEELRVLANTKKAKRVTGMICTLSENVFDLNVFAKCTTKTETFLSLTRLHLYHETCDTKQGVVAPIRYNDNICNTILDITGVVQCPNLETLCITIPNTKLIILNILKNTQNHVSQSLGVCDRCEISQNMLNRLRVSKHGREHTDRVWGPIQSDLEWPGQRLSKLKVLHMEHCYGIKSLPRPLFHLSSNSLVSVRLDGCTNLQDIECLQGCTALTFISLKDCAQLYELRGLENCIQLEILDISNCIRVCSLFEISRCTELIKLVCNGCHWLNNIASVRYFQKLNEAQFGHCPSLLDVSPLSECSRLQTLDLSHGVVSDLSTLAGCVKLRHLDLSHNVNTLNLEILSKCPNLSVLDLRHCNSIFDVTYLGQCPSLQTLYLTHCENITNVVGLENARCLQRLDLDSCYCLENISMLWQCRCLRYLDLSFCECLGEIGSLSRSKSLSVLYLDHEWEFTPEVMTLSCCKSLRNIQFTGKLSECRL